MQQHESDPIPLLLLLETEESESGMCEFSPLFCVDFSRKISFLQHEALHEKNHILLEPALFLR